MRTDVGIPYWPVKTSSFGPGFLSDGNGPTHQAIEDVSLMRGIPGMTVFAPADEADMLAMLPAIWASPDPAYVRVNTRPGTYPHAPFEIGKAYKVRTGRDITFIGTGTMTYQLLAAADMLSREGIEAEVIHCPTIKPLDETTILTSLRSTGRALTLEEAQIKG